MPPSAAARLAHAPPLDEILNTWRQEAAQAAFSRSRDMGTAFEDLCIVFLHHDPVQAAQFGAVEPYGEWARQRGYPPPRR